MPEIEVDMDALREALRRFPGLVDKFRAIMRAAGAQCDAEMRRTLDERDPPDALVKEYHLIRAERAKTRARG